MDKEGEWYAYMSVPQKDNIYGNWDGDPNIEIPMEHWPKCDKNWKDTLTRRPEETNDGV